MLFHSFLTEIICILLHALLYPVLYLWLRSGHVIPVLIMKLKKKQIDRADESKDFGVTTGFILSEKAEILVISVGTNISSISKLFHKIMEKNRNNYS